MKKLPHKSDISTIVKELFPKMTSKEINAWIDQINQALSVLRKELPRSQRKTKASEQKAKAEAEKKAAERKKVFQGKAAAAKKKA